MNDTKYNGWTNYATWRVNLELFDGLQLSDVTYQPNNADIDTYDFSQVCKEYAEYIITESHDRKDFSSIVIDYALAFLSDVNWYEIADHMIRDHIAENELEAA